MPPTPYTPRLPHSSPHLPSQVKAKEARIRALSTDPRIYERLVASISPNVWEMEDVKKGLMCQLFGGSCKNFPGGRIRGEINLLLVRGGEGIEKDAGATGEGYGDGSRAREKGRGTEKDAGQVR